MLIAWICSQELGFVLKSEQREALELLLRGKDVFCVLPTGFDKSLIYQMFVHAKSSSSSVQRPTVIISPVQKRRIGRGGRYTIARREKWPEKVRRREKSGRKCREDGENEMLWD